ncbi:hypothetical protein [[Actinomadura] parvosata]|nr:hypothetical protein [Nonomuraea sp. ATCC 55076]
MSAAPVTDDGDHVLGTVSEAELMTSPAISVSAKTATVQAARLMEGP